VARDAGFLPDAPHETVDRVRVETRGGWVPALLDPASRDPRFLSVFLSFTGERP
jgi:hypothetical protein